MLGRLLRLINALSDDRSPPAWVSLPRGAVKTTVQIAFYKTTAQTAFYKILQHRSPLSLKPFKLSGVNTVQAKWHEHRSSQMARTPFKPMAQTPFKPMARTRFFKTPNAFTTFERCFWCRRTRSKRLNGVFDVAERVRAVGLNSVRAHA